MPIILTINNGHPWPSLPHWAPVTTIFDFSHVVLHYVQPQIQKYKVLIDPIIVLILVRLMRFHGSMLQLRGK